MAAIEFDGGCLACAGDTGFSANLCSVAGKEEAVTALGMLKILAGTAETAAGSALAATVGLATAEATSALPPEAPLVPLIGAESATVLGICTTSVKVGTNRGGTFAGGIVDEDITALSETGHVEPAG